MATTVHGHTADGAAVTDAVVDDLAAEAEQGYDVDTILDRRRPGRPALGRGAASVESVRLDQDLKRDLLLRAAADHTSVSEIIRTAVRRYLLAG